MLSNSYGYENTQTVGAKKAVSDALAQLSKLLNDYRELDSAIDSLVRKRESGASDQYSAFSDSVQAGPSGYHRGTDLTTTGTTEGPFALPESTSFATDSSSQITTGGTGGSLYRDVNAYQNLSHGIIPDLLPSLTDPVPLDEWRIVETWLKNDFMPITAKIGPALTEYLHDHAMALGIPVVNALALKSLLDIVAEVSQQRNNVPSYDLLYSLADVVDGLWGYHGNANEQTSRFAKLAEYIEERLWREEYGQTMAGAERTPTPSADHGKGEEAKELITQLYSVFRKSESEPALQLFAKYRAMSRRLRSH